MTGHFVALSVRREMEGYLGDVEVHKVRRVEVLVLARKGQEALKRDREESLSIVYRVTKKIINKTGMALL
jgi:hypothetical protein